MATTVMCKRCGYPREPKRVDKTPCGWCGYDDTIKAKQRRAERRAAERRKAK